MGGSSIAGLRTPADFYALPDVTYKLNLRELLNGSNELDRPSV
jgi:hypothetical protein